MYQHRHIEEKLKALVAFFKVILLTGARQVGKSTLLETLFPDYPRFVFDPLEDLWRAREDPALFLSSHPPPIILDEIQYSPQILPGIKRLCDQRDDKGLYFLTGSQNFSLMKNVAESMSGRVVLLELSGMTPFEHQNQLKNHWLNVLVETPLALQARFQAPLSLPCNLYELILKGGFPEAWVLPQIHLRDFYQSYFSTYIERDVRLQEDLKNLTDFIRFTRLAAALSSQEIHYQQLGREIGIHVETAQKWLTVLEKSYQWQALPPFHRNTIKRISKKPKGHFGDTGLACSLLGIHTPEVLSGHPMLGHLFETYVFNLVRALNQSLDYPGELFHFRSHGGAEVDLLLSQGNRFFPMEVKCKTQLSRHDARGIHAFIETYPDLDVPLGLILYPGERCFYVTEKVLALPYLALMG